MPTFNITGDIDPVLLVSLKKGETIFCESDAMMMMEDTLDLTGSVQGGVVQAVMRRMANGESFFQQKIVAQRGDGDCLLSPTASGGIQILDVGPQQYRLSDGAYVAATDTVQVTARLQQGIGSLQGIGKSLLGGTGGFFVGETSGSGKVVVSGMGSLFMVDVTPGKDVRIDNGHVVAWESQLEYKLSVTTNKNRGLLGNLVGSVLSGEGIILSFSGHGKVLVCSRNKIAAARRQAAGS